VTVTTPNASELVVVDSTGWVEYFGEGPKAAAFAPYLEREDLLLLPTIVIYEVFRKLFRDRGKTIADRFLSYALRARGVALDAHIALLAARASLDRRLSMADAIIYATAQMFQAELITSDLHFKDLSGVKLI
jgi:toxin FitB